MRTALPRPGNRPRVRRQTAIAISLLAHIAVFTVIGLSVPEFVPHEAPPSPYTHIWLMPRQRLDTPQPIRSTPSRSRSAALAAAPKASQAQPAERPAPPKPARSAPAAGIAQVPPTGGRQAGQANPATAPAEESGGVREALRTSVGCDVEGDDNVVHLTPAEKDKCHQKIGAEARKGQIFNGMDAAKRGRFDAQAAADDRRRAGREGPMQQLVVPCADAPGHAEGANLGGGCLPDASIMHIPQR